MGNEVLDGLARWTINSVASADAVYVSLTVP